MKIGELARAVGVSPSKVRYYESIGLLPAPARRGGKRVYGRDAIDQLRMIGALQYAGFRLVDIRRLLSTPTGQLSLPAWRATAADQLQTLTAKVAELQRVQAALTAALDCTCEGEPSACELVTRAEAARA